MFVLPIYGDNHEQEEDLKMDGRDPSSIAWGTYLWVFAISAWGGLVSFYDKVRAGEVRWCNITELVGEIATSGLVGIITFYLCEYTELDRILTAALIGISGHMGSRALMRMEKWAEKKLDSWLSK